LVFSQYNVLDEIADKSSDLLALYKDEDGLFKKDIREMTGSGIDDSLTEFYARLKNAKDYYRSLPNELALPFDPLRVDKNHDLEIADLEATFSGEESLGKYFDLHESFRTYSNLKV
jgi:hypothetical protein